MRYDYVVYGLRIRTELICPEWPVASEDLQQDVDVDIRWGSVSPNGLVHAVKKGLSFQVGPFAFWLFVPGIARFLVTEGTTIVVDPFQQSDEDSVRVFLLSACLGALLLQRRYLLLHANVIQVGGAALMLAGASGVGKSTLAAIFHNRGYAVLADDIGAIHPDGQIRAGAPTLKLWADVIKCLEIETTAVRKIRPQLEKYVLSTAASFSQQPLALKVIYVLMLHNQSTIKITSLKGIAKYQSVRQHLYRPQVIQPAERAQLALRLASLLQDCTVMQVMRPERGCSIHAFADRIEHHWHQTGG